jgi:amyloid beta precursor protein binding protein 1
VRALKEFVDNEGQGMLPLRGSIPDMFSDSERFIALQNIYRNKAQNDLESIATHVERLLHDVDKPYDYINENQIRLFCKNAYFLKLIRGRSFDCEYDPQTSKLGLFLGDLFTFKVFYNLQKLHFKFLCFCYFERRKSRR